MYYCRLALLFCMCVANVKQCFSVPPPFIPKSTSSNSTILMSGSRYPTFNVPKIHISEANNPPPKAPPVSPVGEKNLNLENMPKIQRSMSSKSSGLHPRPLLQRSKSTNDILTEQDFEYFLHHFYDLYLER